MTDAADTAPDTATETGVSDRLLALQHIDTQADQLRVKRERLPERDNLGTRSDQLQSWERRRTEIVTRLDALTALIEQAEERSTELGADRDRLEAQLKTIIAPREAEALMHEIDTVNGQRDELDDQELAALEEQAALDDELTSHLGAEEALRAAVGQADDALTIACADIDAELAQLDERRADAVSLLDVAAVSRYDTVRASMGVVAVAELKGHRCEGCHLDLSAAEVDTAKDEAAESGYTDCPQCGRMLVV